MRGVSKILAFGAGLAAWAAIGTAQAASVLDQSDIPTSGALSGLATGLGVNQNALLVQTFTAGLTGLLTQVDLAIVGTPLTPTVGGFTVSLRDSSNAELFTTYVNYTEAPNVFATDWTQMLQFDLGAQAFAVAAGEQYAIAVVSDPNQPPGTVTWLVGVDNSLFSYAGGQAFASYSHTSLQPQPRDFGFRTYVDVGAIPEPGVWALMIAGFGAVGFRLRRRTPLAA